MRTPGATSWTGRNAGACPAALLWAALGGFLIGCTVGAIVYYFVIQIVLRLGLGTNDLKLFTALIVALFLAIPYWKGKYARVKVPAGGAKAEVKTGGEQDA